MSLSIEEKKRLRGLGHQLKPVVYVSDRGLSEGVVQETDRALEDHELIKVKFSIPDREVKREVMQDLAKVCEAELIHVIGNIGLFFRKALKPNPKLSNLQRLGY
ncbi:ribosome assembly RNA-binding protein YhbY [Balneatrix alpica]|uniref:Ribosome assembly RNA-binding protein YhbY n=1 Tax=Balneatrix alpica TaxID=75684 RepID=A0ABV5ZBI7_9GAMM|nr:ribosome assembly RNA-binding protein YhbY [Balneatrix alpica]